jgi:hypothetical protein
VEGNGPVKPGNPLSNVASRVPIPVKRFLRFRKMRGICHGASPYQRGFFVTVFLIHLVLSKLIANDDEEEE